MNPLLEASRVSFTVEGAMIVEDIDLTVHPGETVAVTGPSGSGKTTLLYLLAGLLPPSGGSVALDGRPLVQLGTASSGVATVLQGYGLVGLLTAVENVEIALAVTGLHHDQARLRALQALADVGLAGCEHQLADELSGGQQQQRAVARALAARPRLLVADEPTAELDVVSRAVVLGQILALAGAGASVILATHGPDVAAVCARTVTLSP